jgi:hypothetical protein
VSAFDILLGVILAVSAWIQPQPTHSQGTLVVYGDDALIAANVAWHNYDLTGYAFGLSGISPAMLGRVAWVRVPGGRWMGPGLVIDVVARSDAIESIYTRQEIAEVSRATARALGFTNGGRWGEVWFGQCPPTYDGEPELYRPPLALDYAPFEHTPSFYPYPKQVKPIDCRPDDARSMRRR